MDVRLVVVVVVVAIVATGAGLMAMHSGSHSQTSSTITTGSPTHTTTKTSSSGTSLNLEGTWHGSYTGKYGSGEWTWIIEKTNDNTYRGCLKTTGTYAGGWMPISIQVSGNKITVGTVGPNAVTFTGTISGSHASGTWRMTNAQEGGDWSGTRTGPVTSLPCYPKTTTSHQPTMTTSKPRTTQTTITRTTTIQTTTTTTGSGGQIACTPPPPTNYQPAFNELLQATVSVIGQQNIRCIGAFMVGGVQYAANYNLINYDTSRTSKIAQDIANQLSAMIS